MSKKNTNNQQDVPINKSRNILIYALAGIAFIIMVVFIMIESSSGHIIVKNNTDKTLEYVKLYFINDEDQISETFNINDAKPGEDYKIDFDKIDLSYQEANLEIIFKFEGYDEMFTDLGYFNEIFSGKVTVDFSGTDESNILLHVKASSGILPSPNVNCDEEHIINLKEGYIED